MHALANVWKSICKRMSSRKWEKVKESERERENKGDRRVAAANNRKKKEKVADREKEWIFVYLFYGPYHVIWFCRVPQRASFLQICFLPFSGIAPGRIPNFYSSLSRRDIIILSSRLVCPVRTDGRANLLISYRKQQVNETLNRKKAHRLIYLDYLTCIRQGGLWKNCSLEIPKLPEKFLSPSKILMSSFLKENIWEITKIILIHDHIPLKTLFSCYFYHLCFYWCIDISGKKIKWARLIL